MRKVLVTGGLGFIGSHTVVELLNLNYEVLIADNLSNSRIEVLDGIKNISGKAPDFVALDLTQKTQTAQLFQNHSIGSIIHFAAKKAVGESVEKPLLYYENNLLSLINLLELSKEFHVGKFIFSSSCTVYGEPEDLPVTEVSPIKKAASPYGNTKQIGEEIILDFVKTCDQPKVISLRYFNPIGAHDSSLIGEFPHGVPSNIVPYITQTAIGVRDKLSVFGGDYSTHDGTCMRDYVHVVDLAKAHIKALDYCDKMQDSHDSFNVGTGHGSTVLEVIDSFERVSNQKLNYQIVGRRLGDIEKIYAAISKANDVLNWKPERDLDNMMKTAWMWQKTLHAKSFSSSSK